MQLQFLGAAREVTGSSYLLTVAGKQILLDCGMFQGHRKEAILKNLQFLFDPTEIEAVVLSHAHIDHSGRIPLLYKHHFTGPIYCTTATRDLCQYMLLDSAYIQEKDSEYLNRKFPSKDTLEPLYLMEHAEGVMHQFQPQAYGKFFSVTEEVRVCFLDAGHILGSAMVLVEITENGQKTLLGFTGDLGRKELPLLPDPEQFQELDMLITESTYGDRLHGNYEQVNEKLAKVVNETIARGGKIIIPAFAMERTQEILFSLHSLHKAGRIPPLPIFVDSPLAINVTDVFRKHLKSFDTATQTQFVDANNNPFAFGNLQYTRTVKESKELNQKYGPMIILSASGMCETGRILHHLRNNIEDHRNTILIVGYMAEGTLGRKLVEKASAVKIFGQEYKVRAQVVSLDAFSAHADHDDLLKFIPGIQGLKQIFVCHGEEQVSLKFADELRGKLPGVEVAVPHWQERFNKE